MQCYCGLCLLFIPLWYCVLLKTNGTLQLPRCTTSTRVSVTLKTSCIEQLYYMHGVLNLNLNFHESKSNNVGVLRQFKVNILFK